MQSAIRLINGPLAVDLVIEGVLLAIIVTARYKSLQSLEPLATAERRKWIEVHRRHLVTQRIWAKLGLPCLLFPMAAMSSLVTFAPGTTTRTQRLTWFLAAFTISLIIGHLRARRLQQELEGLQ